MKKAGYLLLIVVILFVSACGKKHSKVKYLRHVPVQNPEGIYFQDDPDFVKHYSAYLKKMAKLQNKSGMEDPIYSIENVDSIKGAEPVDDSATGWSVDTVNNNTSKSSKKDLKKTSNDQKNLQTKKAKYGKLPNDHLDVYYTHKVPQSVKNTDLKSSASKEIPSSKSGKFVPDKGAEGVESKQNAFDKKSFVQSKKCTKKASSSLDRNSMKKSVIMHNSNRSKVDDSIRCRKPKMRVKKHEGNIHGKFCKTRTSSMHNLEQYDSNKHINKGRFLQRDGKCMQDVKKNVHCANHHVDSQVMSGKMVRDAQQTMHGCRMEHYLTAKANQNLYIKPSAESRRVILPKIKKYVSYQQS